MMELESSQGLFICPGTQSFYFIYSFNANGVLLMRKATVHGKRFVSCDGNNRLELGGAWLRV